MAKHPAKCPKCGHRVDFDSAVGDHIVCAVCHARLRVPGKGKAHEVTRSPTLTGSPADADPLIGQTLGEFEIVELLGRGGMGAVYKARQASLGRFVAIKILPHSLAANQSFIERFSREARAAAAVSHPNIIEVHAVGQDRGYQYIAMEFVDGETLADVLRREGRLLPHRALAILKQVASALAEGHECGILHRDIKPSNILIDRKGRAKVADFGLAKHEGVDVSVTTTGQALGTPLYMPPEAARGEPFDARSDLYSLGATFYQAVAGKPPFEADTPAQLVVKHLEAKPPPLQSVAPDCPGDLCRIIHRLLRKKPDQRYASTDELLDALDKVETRMTVEQAAATASIATRPATARHSTHRREGVALPKRSTALIAGGIAAALLLVAIVLVVVLWPKGGRATKATVPPGTRTPTTQHRPPSPDAARLEANAAIVYKNIATCIAKKDYAKAQTWLDKLRREYASTEFAAAHGADIAVFQKQIDAYVKGTAKPKTLTPLTPKPATVTPPQPQPPKPEPPPDDERWTEWQDLFDGKTLKGWRVVTSSLFRQPSELLADQGRIVLRAEHPGCIEWEEEFPTTDYEIRLDLMTAKLIELAGVQYQPGVCNVIFPIGLQHCTISIGSFGNRFFGLHDAHQVGAPKQPTGSDKRPMQLEVGRWYEVRLLVTSAKVEAWVNAAKLVDVPREGYTFEVPPYPGYDLVKTLGLKATRSETCFRNIRLRRLKPDAKPEAKVMPWKVYTQWPFDAAEAKRRQEETAKALGVPVEPDIDLGNGVKLTMVLIPAGEFLMGSPERPTPESLASLYGGTAGDYRDERPQHHVRISKPFWLGKCELTQEQWQVVTGRNPSKFQEATNPVEQVSWDDCQTFLGRLNGKPPGNGFRLPTEAEWEYACRAGSAAQFCFGDAKESLGEYAWGGGAGNKTNHPVGQKLPNAWGLHDVHGNVCEWCSDNYGSYARESQTDPAGPPAGPERVMRGGHRGDAWGNCRSASRRSQAPGGSRSGYHGLRVAATLLSDASGLSPRRRPPKKTGSKGEGQTQELPGADRLHTEAMGTANEMARAWDFAGAAAELAKLKVEDKALAERVARRREEIARMAALKAKMIERVNTAKPPLRKSTLGIKGVNAELAKANEQGITTARRADGKTETFAWKDLEPDAVRRLVGYTAKGADDHLSAGILLLTFGDAEGAEKHFADAKEGGLAIERYLDPLAGAAFASAKALLDKGEYPKAETALAAVEKDYAQTPWLAAHKDEVASARTRAKGGIADAEAEKLYAQAARLYEQKDLWGLKPVIDKLKADCPDARLITEATRKPTFTEMAEAVGKLGKFLTVRKDGKGEFKTIQAAIDAAPANSLVEVQDAGPYSEAVVIPTQKSGLSLRGRAGTWPVVNPLLPAEGRVVLIYADGVQVERLVLAGRSTGAGGGRTGLGLGGGSVTARSMVMTGGGVGPRAAAGRAGPSEHIQIDNCVGVGEVSVEGGAWCFRSCVFAGRFTVYKGRQVLAENVVWSRDMGIGCSGPMQCVFRHCTVEGMVAFRQGGAVFDDSVLAEVEALREGLRLDSCNIFGKGLHGVAKPGKRCFSADPQFRDPDNLDFRLKPTSPCRKRASDGGDIGCRFTDEMLGMLKLAHELRRKGIIKF